MRTALYAALQSNLVKVERHKSSYIDNSPVDIIFTGVRQNVPYHIKNQSNVYVHYPVIACLLAHVTDLFVVYFSL